VKPKEYLIRHSELYWRPNSEGYTNNLIEAGLYTKEEAESIEGLLRTPPDKKSHITEHSESIKEDFRLARRMLEALRRAERRKRQ
jgi:hypothetical protein